MEGQSEVSRNVLKECYRAAFYNKMLWHNGMLFLLLASKYQEVPSKYFVLYLIHVKDFGLTVKISDRTRPT